MSTKFTVKQIMTWKPCYVRAKVEALIGTGKTASEIGALYIPADDRVWALVRALRDAKGLTALCDAAGTFALRAHYHAANAYYVYAAAADRAYYVAAAAYYAADAERAAYYAANAAADRAYYAANAVYDACYTYTAAADRAESAAQISYLVEEIEC